MDYNDLVKQYKNMAKEANERLWALEKLSKNPDYDKVKKYAYQRAVKDARAWESPRACRFKTSKKNIPTSEKELKAKINDVNRFLDSITSTKEGIDEVYMNKAKALNKTLELDGDGDKRKLTWQEMKDIFDSKSYKRMSQEYGSSTVLLAFATLKEPDKPINFMVSEAVDKLREIQTENDEWFDWSEEDTPFID